MAAEVLILSDVGLQAINNASAGGQLVDATAFKIGDSAASPLKEDVTDLLGNTLFSGNIHHVEVLNKNTCRFVFEVPAYAVTTDTETKEITIYLSNGSLLGRCVFAEPMILLAGENHRFNCLLVTSRCDLSTINVTIGDYTTLPMTPFLWQLQSPGLSQMNAVTVLDGQQNSDGSTTPILVMRYGAGDFQWAFADHNKIFSGKPKSATESVIVVEGLDLDENESVIGHVVAGNGLGKTRRFRFAANKLTEVDGKPITGLDAQSTIAIWRRISGLGGSGGACSYPPSMDGVGPDWVLQRGYGKCPVWAPQKSGSGATASLYRAPSKLVMNTINYTGNGTDARFPIGDIELENVNYVHPSLGGVQQHRSAFDLSANELEFVEAIDTNIPIELRTFTRAASNGARTIIMLDFGIGDGVTTKFKLSQIVENANYIKAYIRGTRQMLTTYTYDNTTGEVTFVAPIPTGVDIEFRSFRMEEMEGYSTTISSTVHTTNDDTYYIELPFTPQSVEYVEVSQSGAHVHGNLYSLVDNKIVFSGPIRKNLEVEVIIYNNEISHGSPNTNLAGVVVDAVLTGRSLKLIRHGAKPISLPIPGVSLNAGPGINITGQHPFYTIESTVSEQLEDPGANFQFNDYRTLNDTSEILFTHRVNLTSDVQVAVHADFSAILGPGFQTTEGLEVMEYVIGFRTAKSKEPEYGRQITGTNVAGFSSLAGDKVERAFSNASMSRVYDVIVANHQAGYIDVVVKMRVQNANVSLYGALLTLNVIILGTPKIAKNA